MSPQDKDFEIELGRSFSRSFDSKPNPLRGKSQCAFAYDTPEKDAVPIFIAESVLRAIESHAKSNVEVEVGGVLLGAFYRGDEGSFVEVTDNIEAAAAKATGVSLTFTHETWEMMHAEQVKRDPSLMIVGWYHTHPGLGVFVSNEDQFIHTSYFGEPWQVALVADPVYDDWGCFKVVDGTIQRTNGFYVFGSRKEARRVKNYTQELMGARKEPSGAVTAAADLRYGRSGVGKSVWAAIAGLLVLQLVTAWMLLNRQVQPEAKVEHYTAASELLSACDLTGGEQMLRLHILATPQDDIARLEFERLSAILNTPGAESPGLDRVNFMLRRADVLARKKPEPVKRGAFEDLGPDADSKLKLYAANPAEIAYRVYESARSTRAVRLQRALTIQKAARQLTAPLVVKGAWSDKAVEWLEQEPLREMAYGLHSGQEDSESAFDKLSSDEQSVVNSIRAGIGKK